MQKLATCRHADMQRIQKHALCCTSEPCKYLGILSGMPTAGTASEYVKPGNSKGSPSMDIRGGGGCAR